MTAAGLSRYWFTALVATVHLLMSTNGAATDGKVVDRSYESDEFIKWVDSNPSQTRPDTTIQEPINMDSLLFRMSGAATDGKAADRPSPFNSYPGDEWFKGVDWNPSQTRPDTPRPDQTQPDTTIQEPINVDGLFRMSAKICRSESYGLTYICPPDQFCCEPFDRVQRCCPASRSLFNSSDWHLLRVCLHVGNLILWLSAAAAYYGCCRNNKQPTLKTTGDDDASAILKSDSPAVRRGVLLV